MNVEDRTLNIERSSWLRSGCIALLSLFILLLFSFSSPAAVFFDWAPVGDTGNSDDTTGYGAVSYAYSISKYEVRNDQYAEFLNSVAATDNFGGSDPHLYNAGMDIVQNGGPGSYSYTVNSGWEANPVNFVSFFDAMRFVNWLDNGQGSGSTESGVYNIGTGLSETRAEDASYFIPSEDEWYKAAYYDPGSGPGDNYWLYPTQSDSVPTAQAPPGGANSANYYGSGVGDTSDVGAYTGSASYYGTYDQGGNLWEWNEAVISSSRGLRGGSWSSGESFMPSSFRFDAYPEFEVNNSGFRVGSFEESQGGDGPTGAAPEPGSLALIGIGAGLMSVLRKRKKK
ncbi:MAG: SUMF1/EgtB/PvdO family nonheme iron enzyme [Verrucomicrobia bacterium]|nr:SUMF1/EgtB/PvdO family nonheme iron enzyme [Verrucomicrobiota bacterium]